MECDTGVEIFTVPQCSGHGHMHLDGWCTNHHGTCSQFGEEIPGIDDICTINHDVDINWGENKTHNTLL